MSKSMTKYFCVTDADLVLIFSLLQVLYLIKENLLASRVFHYANNIIIKKRHCNKTEKTYNFIKQNFVTATVTVTEKKIKKPQVKEIASSPH